MKTNDMLAAFGVGAVSVGLYYWKYYNSLPQANYISCPIDFDPFANDAIKPEMNSACTFLFTIDPEGKFLALVGQQDPGKAGKPGINVVDISGGGRIGDETALDTANREKDEETGIENQFTILLPNKILKTYEEEGTKKAKIVFLRYFPYDLYVKHQQDFVENSRKVIASIANKFEWRRFGLVEDFFAQLAIHDAENPEMPKLKVQQLSAWLNIDGIGLDVLSDPEPQFRARKAISRLYNAVEMKNIVMESIKSFCAEPAMQNLVAALPKEFPVEINNQQQLGAIKVRFDKANIKKFEIEGVPADLDVSGFAPTKFVGSNTFFTGEHEGRAYVAKTMDDSKFGKQSNLSAGKDPFHTTVAEEVSRRLYEHTGVNLVPGRIIVNQANGVPYYVMPNVMNNTGFASGPFDNEIEAKIPGLYDDKAVVEEMQAGMLIAILTGNYDHIFKNYFWRKNEDGSHTLLLSDLGGSNGSKAGGKISALLSEITPLQFLIFMNQPATLTCSNEPFNRILDFKVLQEIEQFDKYDHQSHYAVLKSAVRDLEALVLLAKQLQDITPEMIAADVKASYAQLAGMDKRTFAEEITWRQAILKDDFKKSTKEFNEATALVNDAAKLESYKAAKAFVKDKANKEHPDFEQNKDVVKKFEKAQKVIAANYTNMGLLELAQQGLAEMSAFLVIYPNCTIEDWHVKTLQSRRDLILTLVFTLANDLQAEQQLKAGNEPKSSKLANTM